MEEKRLLMNSQKTLLNETESNDLFMTLDILLLKATPNLNKYWFQESFIDEIVANQGKYIGLPLVCDTEKLMSSDVFNLGHNYSPIIQKFYSEQIGSYTSFEKKFDENGIAELHGTARISKRNPDLIDVLLSVYNSIGLSFSVEVFAQEYSIDQDNNLIIPSGKNNLLMSDALVSFPACPESQALRLVAEINNTLSKGNKGGDTMSKPNKKDILSELSHSDIRSQLHNLMNPNFDKNGYRVYDYWVMSVYDDYVIASDEKTAGVYWKFPYTIENDLVTLGEKTQVTIQFVSINSKGGKSMENINIDINEIIKEKDALLLQNEQMKKDAESLKSQIDELKKVEVKLNEANETIVSLGKDKDALNAQVEELTLFKNEQVEAENTAKIEAIVAEVKADMNEEELKALNEVIETKDVQKVQYFVNEVCAKKYKESIKITASKGDNFFAVPKQKDLAGGDELSKFNM